MAEEKNKDLTTEELWKISGRRLPKAGENS